MTNRFLLGVFSAIVLAACGGGAAQPASSASPRTATDPTVHTLAELFEGKFPGVAVTSVNGGTGVRLRIRNATNPDGSPGYPLFVVDGLPIQPPDGVFSMRPTEVLKIEILKDDASTLIWGERAANGLVKITTRRR
jgi:hypothetical protein